MFCDIFYNFAFYMEKRATKRIEELDWLKAVCIIFMVAFHLVFIEHTYPNAKLLVYVFHMPIFLIISGYLMNTGKAVKPFLRDTLSIAWPYAIMESAYIIAASVLPINEHIDHLTPLVFADKLLIHPIGPYWFLHTLVMLSAINYAAAHICKQKPVVHAVAFILLAFVISRAGVLSFALALYYLIGAVLRNNDWHFLSVFKAFYVSPILLVVLVVLCFPFGKEDVMGVAFNYLVISTLMLLCKYAGERMRNAMLFIGRNTLPVLLFSPLFTLVAKFYQPMLCSMDGSGMLFLLVSVALGVYGSIGIKLTLDRFGLGKLLFIKG